MIQEWCVNVLAVVGTVALSSVAIAVATYVVLNLWDDFSKGGLK
jgi:hypothetical protein